MKHFSKLAIIAAAAAMVSSAGANQGSASYTNPGVTESGEAVSVRPAKQNHWFGKKAKASDDYGQTAALKHWKLLADREAASLAPALLSRYDHPGTAGQPQQAGHWGVEISPENDSVFSRTFSRMLMSSLSSYGVPMRVAGSASDGAVVTIHVDRRELTPQDKYIPGSLTALTAGLWIVHGLINSTTPAGVATVLAVAADIAISNSDLATKPTSELALTLVASDQGMVAASTTSVYLIADTGNQEFATLTPAQSLHFTK